MSRKWRRAGIAAFVFIVSLCFFGIALLQFIPGDTVEYHGIQAGTDDWLVKHRKSRRCVVYANTDALDISDHIAAHINVAQQPTDRTESVEVCCQRCLDTQGCRAWTRESSSGHCLLKYGLWQLSSAGGMQTGFVTSIGNPTKQSEPPMWTGTDLLQAEQAEQAQEANKLIAGLQRMTPLRDTVSHGHQMAGTLVGEALQEWHQAQGRDQKGGISTGQELLPRPSESGGCMLFPGYQIPPPPSGCRDAKGNSTESELMLSANECCEHCRTVPGCRGFDFDLGTHTCHLSYCIGNRKAFRHNSVGGIVFSDYDHSRMEQLWNPKVAVTDADDTSSW